MILLLDEPETTSICNNYGPRCFICGDVGFTFIRDLGINTCWRMKAGAEHAVPNDAARILGNRMISLIRDGIALDPHHFELAKLLAGHTSDVPCKRRRILDGHFSHSKDPQRAFTGVVETLRRLWCLPVGSRKEDPSGYWLITELDDFREWVNRAKAAPITQLRTIHRVAQANFPVFAEQMELEFWADMDPQEVSVDVAAA